MELATYWGLIFVTGQEYIIKTNIEDINTIINKLGDRGIFFKDRGCIALKKDENSEPVFIMSDKLFSVQKIKTGALTTQSKIWSLV